MNRRWSALCGPSLWRWRRTRILAVICDWGSAQNIMEEILEFVAMVTNAGSFDYVRLMPHFAQDDTDYFEVRDLG